MGAAPRPWIRHCYISEMVEDRWVHAARRLTSIEFSFDPCNIYRGDPRGVATQLTHVQLAIAILLVHSHLLSTGDKCFV